MCFNLYISIRLSYFIKVHFLLLDHHKKLQEIFYTMIYEWMNVIFLHIFCRYNFSVIPRFPWLGFMCTCVISLNSHDEFYFSLSMDPSSLSKAYFFYTHHNKGYPIEFSKLIGKVYFCRLIYAICTFYLCTLPIVLKL